MLVSLVRRLSVLALGALLTTCGATPAFAAGELEVSPDGTSWGSQLVKPLFSDVALVPRGSVREQFMVRNASGDDALLRVVLQDVDYSSPVIGDALLIGVGLGGTEREPAALSSAAPCRVLFEGRLPAGQARSVTAELTLGDLPGTEGQGETARFGIGIQLSHAVLGDLPPTACGEPTTVVEVTPFDSRVATIALIGVAPNTWRHFEELLVLVLIVAAFAGVAAQWLVAAWNRRRHERNREEQQYREDLA